MPVGNSSTRYTARGTLKVARFWRQVCDDLVGHDLVVVVARRRDDEGDDDLAEELVLLADHRDGLHRGMGEDEVLDLLGRHVLAADLQQVLVALLVEDVAALAHLHHVAGLEPAVLERLGVGLVVVEVLEEELDPAGAAHPQLAGLALGAELAGLLVDHRDLVPGSRRDPSTAPATAPAASR